MGEEQTKYERRGNRAPEGMDTSIESPGRSVLKALQGGVQEKCGARGDPEGMPAGAGPASRRAEGRERY